MAEQGQRTEKPTQKRLDKSRKEGRFPVSRDLVQAGQFLAFTILLMQLAPEWITRAAHATRRVFALGVDAELTPRSFYETFAGYLLGDLRPVLWAGSLLSLVALAVQLASTQFGIAFSRLRPDPSRLNPFARIASLPSQNLVQAVKAIVLLPVLMLALWLAVRQNLEGFQALSWLPVRSGMLEVGAGLRRLLWYGTILLLVSGLIDWNWQRFQLNKTLKMSKQEIREESKESEGNPETKNRIRRTQREIARRNMMRDLPKATAVIVNPTHYSVAVHYSVDSPLAPRVIAKGKNYLALRIRQRAIIHGIPIVENQPLAQALYNSVALGHEIPPHLYRAVAEVLAYIYRLMNGRLPG